MKSSVKFLYDYIEDSCVEQNVSTAYILELRNIPKTIKIKIDDQTIIYHSYTITELRRLKLERILKDENK